MKTDTAPGSGPKPGDTFTVWGEDESGLMIGELHRVTLVEIGGEDPMFFAKSVRCPQSFGRWPVSMWSNLQQPAPRGGDERSDDGE